MIEPVQLLLITSDEALRGKVQAVCVEADLSLMVADASLDGLKSIPKLQPECLLLDYPLACLSSTLSVIDFVDDRWTDVPLVCLLDPCHESIANRLMMLGFDDFVTKSRLSADRLLSLIQRSEQKTTQEVAVPDSYRVLVVDDSVDDRELIRRRLAKSTAYNLEFIEAESGSQALAYLMDEDPDCMFLDYSMPGDNGLSVLRRSRLLRPFLPVIILTGQGSESVATDAIKAGAHYYLVKSSLTPEVLDNALQSALNRRTLEQSIVRRDMELSEKEYAEKEWQERLKLILDATHSATWDLNLQTPERLVTVNEHYFHMLGLPIEEEPLTSEFIEQQVHPEDQGKALAHFLEHEKVESSKLDLICRMKHQQRGWRWIQIKGKITDRDDNGVARRVVGTYQDVTAEKTAVDQLMRTNQELERFAYLASHDLQEPLRMVICFTALLSKQYAEQLDDRARQYIEFASSSAQRMQEMIKSLLEYAQTGSVSEAIKDVDLNKIIASVTETLALSIQESGAQITAETLPVIRANEAQIQSLFQNLLGNAIKYRKPHCAVVIQLTVRWGKGSCLITIEDNGIGMKQEYCEKIFEPFQRLHRKDEFAGTGIGLSICRKIIGELGGEIWAESTPEVGTRFKIKLPLSIVKKTEER